MEELRNQLQAFKAYSSTIDDVNSLYNKLPINERHVRNLQTLNDRWKDALLNTVKKWVLQKTEQIL